MSDWVKDEAQEGVTRGILVPILIDNVVIPIGFRQIQTVNFAEWDGSALYPEVKELINSIAILLNKPPVPQPPDPIKRTFLIKILLIIVSFLIIGGIYYIYFTPPRPEIKTDVKDLKAIPSYDSTSHTKDSTDAQKDFLISGFVLNQASSGVRKAKVLLYDSLRRVRIRTAETNETGNFNFRSSELKMGAKYQIKVIAQNYQNYEINIEINSIKLILNPIILKPSPQQVEIAQNGKQNKIINTDTTNIDTTNTDTTNTDTTNTDTTENLKQNEIEIHLSRAFVIDNRTSKAGFLPGFSKMYLLIVTVSDVTNTVTLDLRSYAKVGDNEELPINKPVFYWNQQQGRSPSQIHVLTSIIKRRYNFWTRDF